MKGNRLQAITAMKKMIRPAVIKNHNVLYPRQPKPILEKKIKPLSG